MPENNPLVEELVRIWFSQLARPPMKTEGDEVRKAFAELVRQGRAEDARTALSNPSRDRFQFFSGFYRTLPAKSCKCNWRKVQEERQERLESIAFYRERLADASPRLRAELEMRIKHHERMLSRLPNGQKGGK